MAKFSYKARNTAGEMVEGNTDAADRYGVVEQLKAMQLMPLKIAEEREGGAAGSITDWFKPKVSLEELITFSRQMYSLSKSGIPLMRAIEGLEQSTKSPRLQSALADIGDQLSRGRNLSTAFNRHPDIFNQLYVSLIHVGENSGNMDEAFLALANYLMREQETRKQIKSATRYPIFVLAAIVMALVIMNIFVIPTFADMFESLGAELPPMTKFLIGMSNLFVNYWHLMLIGMAVAFYGIRAWVNTERGEYLWDKYKLKLYAVGSIMTRSLLARFARSFTMMMRAGVPLTYALNLVADAVDNQYMATKIVRMREGVERGESLSRVCQASGLFTPLVMQMIQVGEEIGQVDELLTDVAEFYEREVDYDLKALTAKIEPILIGIVAGMVLVLALGIFTPMWDMMGAITG